VFTHAERDIWLNHYRGTQPAVRTSFASLLTGVTDHRAGTVAEAAYTGYARINVTSLFGAPANTSPEGGREIANNAAVTFAQNTGSSENEIAFGIHSAVTAGTLFAIGFLDADKPIYAAVTDTTTDRFETHGAHGLVADQRVFIIAVPGSPLPTGVSEDTNYFVGTVVDTEAVTLSTTAGNGAPVAITAVGGCLMMPNTAVTVATNATPEFAIGALVIQV